MMKKFSLSKKVMPKRKNDVKKQDNKNTTTLELVVKSNGEYTKLSLPVKVINVQTKTSGKKVNLISVDPSVQSSIIIDNLPSRYFTVRRLLHKKVHFIRDTKRLEGIIMRVGPTKKSPDGDPVPTPPQPLN